MQGPVGCSCASDLVILQEASKAYFIRQGKMSQEGERRGEEVSGGGEAFHGEEEPVEGMFGNAELEDAPDTTEHFSEEEGKYVDRERKEAEGKQYEKETKVNGDLEEQDLVDEDNAELLALYRIDEASTKLQQEGKYLEALECMERGLVLRQHFFGTESDHVWDACKTVGEMCNLLAMTYLQQEDFPMVLNCSRRRRY